MIVKGLIYQKKERNCRSKILRSHVTFKVIRWYSEKTPSLLLVNSYIHLLSRSSFPFTITEIDLSPSLKIKRNKIKVKVIFFLFLHLNRGLDRSLRRFLKPRTGTELCREGDRPPFPMTRPVPEDRVTYPPVPGPSDPTSWLKGRSTETKLPPKPVSVTLERKNNILPLSLLEQENTTSKSPRKETEATCLWSESMVEKGEIVEKPEVIIGIKNTSD